MALSGVTCDTPEDSGLLKLLSQEFPLSAVTRCPTYDFWVKVMYTWAGVAFKGL